MKDHVVPRKPSLSVCTMMSPANTHQRDLMLNGVGSSSDYIAAAAAQVCLPHTLHGSIMVSTNDVI